MKISMTQNNGVTIINGKKYHGNVTIVNGQVVEGNPCEESTFKKINETKKENSNGIERIYIEGDINIKVSAYDGNEIIAHMHGSSSENYILSMEKSDNTLEINVDFENSSKSSFSLFKSNSIVINNFNSANNEELILDVQIPAKVFETFKVSSTNSSIFISSDVNCKKIDLKNCNGSIEVAAAFNDLRCNCVNGWIDVKSEVKNNVNLDVSTINGSINVALSNIGHSDVHVKTINGLMRNNPRLGGKYNATGYISTTNGNIEYR